MTRRDRMPKEMQEGREKELIPFAAPRAPALETGAALKELISSALKGSVIGFGIQHIQVRSNKVGAQISRLRRRPGSPRQKLKAMVLKLPD